MNNLKSVLLVLGALILCVPAARAAGAQPDPARMALQMLIMGNKVPGDNWMQFLDDKVRLEELSIPGTHDSGARYDAGVGTGAFRVSAKGTAKCQEWDVGKQLQNGVRFLDIRCRHYKDRLDIYHGVVDQDLSFHKVLDEVIFWLNSHPRECVMMMVKSEGTDEKNSSDFQDCFIKKYWMGDIARKARWTDHYWVKDRLPKNLGEARGKLILFRRFEARRDLPLGIDVTSWGNNRTFDIYGNVAMRVQDYYECTDLDRKQTEVKSMYEQASKASDGRLYLNYTSGYKPGVAGIPNIKAVSERMNKFLTEYFPANSKSTKLGHFGITAMDFADEQLARRIFMTNFPLDLKSLGH